MLFNSVEYIGLLAVSLVAYWVMPWLLARQLVVFVASAWFYMSWSTPFLLLLLFLVGINWLIAGRLSQDGRRLWLVLACVIDIGLLAWFKYAQFIAENIAAFFSREFRRRTST